MENLFREMQQIIAPQLFLSLEGLFLPRQVSLNEPAASATDAQDPFAESVAQIKSSPRNRSTASRTGCPRQPIAPFQGTTIVSLPIAFSIHARSRPLRIGPI